MTTAGMLTTAEHNPTASTDAFQPDATSLGPIVFFDGVCGLCNESVDRLIQWDRQAVFRLAPLQGETARQVLTPADTSQLGSVVLHVDGRSYRKSSAVVRILWRLGPLGLIAGTALWLIPRPMRDFGYAIIAQNRYRWFGKKETCRMPTPKERSRFLP